MTKNTAAAARERKRAPGKGRERTSTNTAASSRRGSDPGGAAVDGNAIGAAVFGPGYGSDGAAVAPPLSGPESGRSPAGVGGGAPGATGSGTAAVAAGLPPDGSQFFTGTTSSILGKRGGSSSNCSVGGGGSLIPPPLVRPQTWDTNPHPPSGFMSFFHNQPQQSPNFHHVGAPNWRPFRVPHQVDVAGDSPPPVTPTPTPHPSAENPTEHKMINLDSGDEVVSTEKRILWTTDEDHRLMSAWVNNSKNSMLGTDRRNEQYWSDVTEIYNLSTPRKRNMKQAKDRWHKINKWTDLFHSAWCKAKLVFSSGHSEQDWIDKAHKFYLADNKDQKLGPFVLMEVWYSVRNEPKWITYNKGLKQAHKRKESDTEAASENVDDDEHPVPRPIGQKKAKRLFYEGKSPKSALDVDGLNIF